MITITKHVEFDAGHRVPSHQSKCKNAHGHRYKLDVTIGGEVWGVRGKSDDGMIMDFGEIKQMIVEVVEPWDHAFLVYTCDYTMRNALGLLGVDHKTVVLDDIPTAEHLVEILADKLSEKLEDYGEQGGTLELYSLRLYETPNSWADWYSPNYVVRRTESW